MTKEIIDKKILDQLTENDWLYEANLKAALEQLKAEGLPTDLQTINKLTETETSFREYIVSLQRQRLSGGFIPVTERELVVQAFSDLFDRLNKKVSDLRGSLHSGLVLKAAGDSVEIDKAAIEAQMLKKATIRIDEKKAQEYYQMFIAVINAFQALQAFEKEGNYPNIITRLEFHELYQLGHPLAREGTVSEETFVYVLRHYLKQK